MTDLILERFWNKVEADPITKCWNWTKALNKDGYGIFRIDIKEGTILSHRFAYETNKGVKPFETTLDHLCRNRKCVNPEHLEAVSLRENQVRGNSLVPINAKKKYCLRGHLLEGINLIEAQKKVNKRCCKVCAKIRYIQAKKLSSALTRKKTGE